MRDNLFHSPLLLLAACFAAGILLADSGLAAAAYLPLLTILAWALWIAGLLLLHASWERAAHAALILGFIAAGAVATHLFERRFPPDHIRHVAAWGVDLADAVRLEGRVASTPQRKPDAVQFDMEVERVESRGVSLATRGKVRLRMFAGGDPESMELAESLRLDYGDSVSVMARLRKPRIYRNPGSFDYLRWLESVEDIPFTGTIKSPHLVEKIPGKNRGGAAKWIETVRARLLEGIDRVYPPWRPEGRVGAVLKAVLLGDRSSLSTETVENFRRTGLYHQLVVSGLQLGLLAFLAATLLRWLRLREEFQIVLLLAAMLAYALLLEQRAPTLRATLMIFVYLGARFLYRERALLNAIGASALVLLLIRPFWLFESGFQLSFAAALLIAGLAVPILDQSTEAYRRALRQLNDVNLDSSLAPHLAQFRLDLRGLVTRLTARVSFFERHPAVGAKVITVPIETTLWTASALVFSAILQVGLLLPMTETFHRVTLAGILLNALATPLMTILLGLAAPTVVLAAVSPALASVPAQALSWVTSGFVAVAEFHGFPGWVTYRVPDPPLWVSLGFAIFIILTAWFIGKSARLFWISLGVAGIFAALISFPPFPPRLPRGALEVTALDCGGGDAVFVVLPDRTTLLVDACGSRAATPQEGAFSRGGWDQGENVVSPYLWSRGITRIDRVILSHAKQDHLGGLAAIFRNFRVGEFWHGANPLTPAYLRLLRDADGHGIRDRQLAAGQTIQIGGAEIEVLWPPPDRPVGERPSDDDSLVLRITAAGGSAMLTGDISEAVERELLLRGTAQRSDILKVAGHGTRSSSSAGFVGRVSPKVALITAASGSADGLPSPETTERLASAGAKIYQTDSSGAVTVQARGGEIVVRSFADSPRR